MYDGEIMNNRNYEKTQASGFYNIKAMAIHHVKIKQLKYNNNKQILTINF